MKFLDEEYPCLAVYVMRRRGMYDRLNSFVARYLKLMHKDEGEYTQYIHGCLLPNFQEMRERGYLTKGIKKISFDGLMWDYRGELDNEGNACARPLCERRWRVCSFSPTHSSVALFVDELRPDNWERDMLQSGVHA